MKNLIITVLVLSSTTGVFSQKLNWKERKLEKSLKKHIGYLASDKLEGRLTGSAGEKLSADYIAGSFKMAGLIPMGEGGTYFQKFEITSLRMATDQCNLEIGKEFYKLFSKFFPISQSANKANVSTEIVSVAFGIKSTEPERDDYKDKNVTGKIVTINLGSPDGVHPHSKFLAWHGIESRINEAIKQGAAGVLLFRNSENINEPDGNLSLKIKPSAIPVFYVRSDISDIPDGTPVKLVSDIMAVSETGHNVIGFKNNKASNTVVIGAHHDHLGRGEMGGSLSDVNGVIHNGADDNASGVAAMIELTKLLKKSKKWNKNNNYLFIAFSGEELGLIGSKYFVANPTYPLEKINYMINMDMVGKLDSTRKILMINGVGTSPSWTATLAKVKTSEHRIASVNTTEGGIGSSDHTSFYLSNIPSVHFFSGQHVYYHKPSDDIAIINWKGEVFIVEYIRDFIGVLNESGKLQFTKTKDQDSNSRMNFKVTLGIMPDYLFSGEGLKVDGVKEGHPGAAAGILKGDIIISFNGVFIDSIQDYMKELGKIEKGAKIPLQVKRGENIVDLEVRF
jgi:Zn-dependent M28 family amino/carboxypeptidase